MASNDLASIERRVVSCVSKKREIHAAYVFGSVMSGRTRRDSDVDIAVLLDDRMTPSRRFQYRLKLMAELGSALHRSDIDLVILNEASPLLAHRVLSKGNLVYEGSAS